MNTSKVVMRIVKICFTVLILLLIVFTLYRTGQNAYSYGYRIFTEPPVSTAEDGTDKVVQITENMSAKEIGGLLERKGLIRDSFLFVLQLKTSAYADDIKSGTYTLSTSMTAKEMIQIMSAQQTDTETEE